ncbi:MAG: alpha/beta hydrolase [Bacteroidales bacterium]
MIIILSFACTFSYAQKNYPPNIEEAEVYTYKVVNDVNLKLWVFNPPKHKIESKVPAIVFFFGGGWNAGSPSQFVHHCEYLAARGIVAMVADYRVYSRNKVRANICVADAKSALRWVREHASEIGVDPNRIVAGGGSAGGHLAASTACLPDFDEPTENLSISSKPNALVLFNPALVLAPINGVSDEYQKKLQNLEIRLGAKPESMSPFHQIKKGLPPTIIFHGTDDQTVPFKTVVLFAEKMKEMGNECTVVAYQDEQHGFFNYGKKANGAFIDSVNRMDQFLVSLGYLQPTPKTNVLVE